MVKDMSIYMDGSEAAFEQVLAACDELIDAKLILAETKVSALLQRIAASKKAYELLDAVLKGFDFNYEFNLAKQKNALGTYSLTLPGDDRRLAAFVFCLLLEFDTTSCDLQSFLDVYFYSENPTKSFESFINEMIVPFKQSLSTLRYDGIMLAGEQPKDRLASGEMASAPRLPGGDATDLDALYADIGTMSEKLSAAELEQSDYDDAALALSSLSKALMSADREGIRLAYTAFKRTVSSLDALDIVDGDLLSFGKKLVALGAIPSV